MKVPATSSPMLTMMIVWPLAKPIAWNGGGDGRAAAGEGAGLAHAQFVVHAQIEGAAHQGDGAMARDARRQAGDVAAGAGLGLGEDAQRAPGHDGAAGPFIQVVDVLQHHDVGGGVHAALRPTMPDPTTLAGTNGVRAWPLNPLSALKERDYRPKLQRYQRKLAPI